MALVGCSTPTATPSTTATTLLTPTVLAEVDGTIRDTRGEELFLYQRVEAETTTLLVYTGLRSKQENADLAMGLCGHAARGLIEAGAESASVRVLAANGDYLALTLGPAGRDGQMAGTCRLGSAFNRRA